MSIVHPSAVARVEARGRLGVGQRPRDWEAVEGIAEKGGRRGVLALTVPSHRDRPVVVVPQVAERRAVGTLVSHPRPARKVDQLSCSAHAELMSATPLVAKPKGPLAGISVSSSVYVGRSGTTILKAHEHGESRPGER